MNNEIKVTQLPSVDTITQDDLLMVVQNNENKKATARQLSFYNLDNYYTKSETDTLLNEKANTSDLANVATSGSYNDLSNKPTNVSTFTNDANYVTSNGNAETTQTNVSSATFENTLEAPMNIDLKGNTLQNGTPTPSSPIPINNVSGDNQIVVSDGGTDTTTYNIDLPSGMELCKIGTYQDYIYKENDKWYLHKEIGKVVLNGSEDEDWRYAGINNNYVQFNLANIGGWNNCNSGEGGSLFKNKYFKYYADAGSPSKNDSGIRIWGNGNPKVVFSVPTNILTTGSKLSSFKTWLSNNSNYFYYVLATPTNTEITYTPLIEQLESIKNAMSKEGTTNDNQVNNDAPFILDLSVFNDTYNGRYQSVLEMYKRLSNQ